MWPKLSYQRKPDDNRKRGRPETVWKEDTATDTQLRVFRILDAEDFQLWSLWTRTGPDLFDPKDR